MGYGCSTCVGNTAPLSEAVLGAVKQVRPLREGPGAFAGLTSALMLWGAAPAAFRALSLFLIAGNRVFGAWR